MSFDQNPIFRKAFIPWYDKNVVCVVVILFMSAVCLFGFAGISVALENLAYYRHILVPVFLVVMSGGVIVSTLCRLIKRFFQGSGFKC